MSFVNELHTKYEAKFTHSVTHAFTNELCNGTLSDCKLYTYLVQDLKFFQLGLCLFGNALRLCDDAEAAIVLGKQIGFLSHDENTYFDKSLGMLRVESAAQLRESVPLMLQDSPPTLPAVQEHLDAMSSLAFGNATYAEIACFLYVMEKVYLGWAQVNIEKGNTGGLQYKHKEWVNLHSGPDFEKWVAFLESEVNRVAVNQENRRAMENWFDKLLDLEIGFFEACYNYSG